MVTGVAVELQHANASRSKDSAQSNVNMQQVSEILKLFTQLIQLLGLGGGSGGASNMLKQLVFSFWTR